MSRFWTLPLTLCLLAACPASKRGDAPQEPNSVEDVEPFTDDHAKVQQPNRLPPAPPVVQAPNVVQQPNVVAKNPNSTVRSPSLKVVK